MNERIKELEKQSVFYNEDEEIWETNLEKFAELIVQECLDQITRFKTEYHVQDHALVKIKSIIVKHFGVEE